ncbi:hypothetical protein Tco_1349347 [Tanacetum coccineum]
MESSKSSQPNHPYSPINRINLDMDFKHNIFSQDYNYSQDYSMGYGSGHGSAHGSAPVNDEEEDDSPVEEVSPVKPKKPSRRASKAKKDDPNEPPIDWTVAEKIALYQAWCDVSENNIAGNNMKTRGFWDAVITYFEKETGSTRANHESGTNDLDVYHKACAEYKMIYKQDFTLEHCYNVLKDHQGWLDVEMPTSGSASGAINLNDEEDEVVGETQEVRPMGRDQSKAKKKSAGSSRGGSSSFVDLVADKFLNINKKMGKEVRGKTVVYRVEESGVEYLGGRGSGSCTVEKRET